MVDVTCAQDLRGRRMWLGLRIGHVVAMLLVAFVAPGCAMDATEPTALDSSVKSGQWGGQHIAMTVAASETSIEFDCGKATITGAITTDKNGAFTVTGIFFQERPGPTTPGGPAQRPMRLSGNVKGDDMQVNIVLTDQNEDVGSFTLSFGGAARLVKCR
jgi:hypothetical protein